MISSRWRAAENAHRDFQRLAGGKLSWIEGESLTADGNSTSVEVRAGRVEYNGKPALLLHVRDITERRAAEAAVQSSEMLFRSVWENSVDGMRLTDENGVIIAVNKSYCNLVGMEAEQLEGKLFTLSMPNPRIHRPYSKGSANISAPAPPTVKFNGNIPFTMAR